MQIKPSIPIIIITPRGSDEEVSSRVGGGEVARGVVVSVALVGDHVAEDERRV